MSTVHTDSDTNLNVVRFLGWHFECVTTNIPLKEVRNNEYLPVLLLTRFCAILLDFGGHVKQQTF